MDAVFIGGLIREARQQLGMSQEKLCEGLCEPITILRIENGQTDSSRSMRLALLQKLGLPERYLYFPSQKELEIDDLKAEARAQTIAFGKAAKADRAERRESALQALHALEKKAGKKDILIRQFIMAERIGLGTEEGPYSPSEQREQLLDAIYVTNSKFDLDQMGSFRYTQAEIELINQIAITYALEGNRDAAISIYRQLLTYIQENNQQLHYYAGQLTMVTFNYVRELVAMEKYEEAIAIAEVGRKVCVKYDNHQLHPQLLAILANCYAHLGNREKSRKFYERAFCMYEAFEDLNNLAHLRNDAEDTLGLDL